MTVGDHAVDEPGSIAGGGLIPADLTGPRLVVPAAPEPPLVEVERDQIERVRVERALAPPTLAEMVAASGLRRIHMLAWRDLDDPEAGGSELHADRVATIWATAGLDVSLRTAEAPGQPTRTRRNGYDVVRKAGRYTVFPRTALSGAIGRTGPRDGLVEIWNGMPFFSPVWAGCPRIVFLHHVHAEMWRMVLPPALARIGETIEFRLAPPFYRRTRIVTLSESSRREIISMLGMPPANVSVVAPGIAPVYAPDGPKPPDPLVVAVGRLVPVKRFDILIDALVKLRAEHPTLTAVIVGEGYDRAALEARVAAAGATGWLTLPGHVDDATLLDLYRRAWVVAASSAREGWGMTLTEAAACGTPAVATKIAGHTDAVVDGRTGLLVDDPTDLFGALTRVLADEGLRERLSAGALAHASRFTWEATARATFAAHAAEAASSRARSGGTGQ